MASPEVFPAGGDPRIIPPGIPEERSGALRSRLGGLQRGAEVPQDARKWTRLLLEKVPPGYMSAIQKFLAGFPEGDRPAVAERLAYRLEEKQDEISRSLRKEVELENCFADIAEWYSSDKGKQVQ